MGLSRKSIESFNKGFSDTFSKLQAEKKAETLKQEEMTQGIQKLILGEMAKRGEIGLSAEGGITRTERPSLPQGFEVTEYDPMTNLPRKAERVETLQDFLGGGTGQIGQGSPQIGSPDISQANIPRNVGLGVSDTGFDKKLFPDKDVYRLEDFKFKGKTYKRQPSRLDAQQGLAKKAAEEEVKLKAAQNIQAQKYKANFYQTVGLFKRTVAQIKGKEEEQGGLGLLPGLKGAFGATTKQPGFGRTSAAYGQRTETSLRMNSMLTGQNRVIKSVVSMIEKSLPGDYDPPDQVAAKISQSLRNAYILSNSFKKSGLSPEVFKKMSPQQLDGINAEALVASYNLTPQEEQEIDMIIKDVLSTQMAQPQTLLNGRNAPKVGSMFQGERITNVEVIQ